MARNKGREQEPGSIANLGEPIRLSRVDIAGISLNAVRKGEKAQMCTRLSISSDDPFFHTIVPNLGRVLEYARQQDGASFSLDRAHTVLLVIHADKSADLWLDSASMSVSAMIKRPVEAGAAIFETDIADITGMDFPLVEIRPSDGVVCIFREGWRFGLFFDFNPDGGFERRTMVRELGRLYRTMKFSHLYEVIADAPLFASIVALGWFPFVEIVTTEFKVIASYSRARFDFADIESEILAKFDRDRLERIFARWMTKPHFADKRQILQAAVDDFLAGRSIPAMKVALSEIEGLLNAAYRAEYGRGAKLPKLLGFVVDRAEKRAGARDTLLFPAAFAHYLKNHTFAQYSRERASGAPGSRHAILHGEAPQEAYTQVRALQALLTLDQISFYT